MSRRYPGPVEVGTPPRAPDKLLDIVKLACIGRGVAGIKMLGRTFRIFDDDGNKRLNFEEFKWGLRDYRIPNDSTTGGMTDTEAKFLFDDIDKDNTGNISFDEFLSKLQPPMSPSRSKLVFAVFKHLASLNTGTRDQTITNSKGIEVQDSMDCITYQDIMVAYDVTQHPKFKSGEWTKKQCLEEFIHTFEPDKTKRDGVIEKEEFILYYEGVSASIDRDVYFDYMMRQAWPHVFKDTSDRWDSKKGAVYNTEEWKNKSSIKF